MTTLPVSSISRATIASPWRRPPAAVPTIVAEALVSLGHAPPALRSGLEASPAAVAGALARAALPPEAGDTPPQWLRAGQRRTFLRVVAALREFGGVLLADPVGTGKTYIALAAAQALGRERAACIVPAAVADQWRETAARLGIDVVISTHERASRGALPPAAGLVIVDESHHFRNTGIRRYTHVARWLVGRRTLLLSATPVVNRLADLTAQLALVVRDDVLGPFGVSSIRAEDGADTVPAAFARIVLLSSVSDPALPSRQLRRESGTEHGPTDRLVSGIERLALSRSPGIASLVRGVLWRAASSSPAALEGALRRYRLLLLHAQDAAEAGVRVGRAALRTWVGEAAEQTALWPLLDDDGEVELRLDDLDALDGVVALAGEASGSVDAKAARLRDVVGDGRRTIVFTAARETVPWLRDRLAPERVAWCTGAQAGIGHVHLARGDVLAAFRPGAPEGAASARVLVTTDVAAEGLDLQLAERVIHYDLPWTPMRLEQREGRAARIGAPHATVEVVRFDPPAQLEARLRQTQILLRKAGLPARAGLADTSLRRWREVLDAASESTPRTTSGAAACAAVTTDEAPGALAGLCLMDIGRARSVGGALIWIDGAGRGCSDPLLLASRLELAAREVNAAGSQGVPQRELDRTLRHLAGPSRSLLRAAHGAGWARRQRSPAASRLAERLIRLGRDAARRRDGDALDIVDHALRFLARGHTAGERLLIEELAVCPASGLSARLAALPPGLDPSAYEVRLEGIILFRSRGPRLR